MLNELHTFEISDGIYLHCIKDSKFLTGSLSFFLRMPLTPENAARASLLALILKSGCKEYPSVSTVNRRLQDLYGCEMDIFTFKKGTQLILCLNLQFTDRQWVLDKVFALAGNILLSPKHQNNKFDDIDFQNSVFIQSKKIRALYDDKPQYAMFRLTEEMAFDAADNEASRAFGLSADGNLKEISLVTPSTLYDFYNWLINHCHIDVYCVSGRNADDIKSLFTKMTFMDMAREKPMPFEPIIGKNTEGRHVAERAGLEQTILAAGYTFESSNIYAAEIFNEVLSGGGESLLFNNVRQKNGLCYNIWSKIYSLNGVLAVCAGIDKSNIETVTNLIKEAITNSTFTEDMLKKAKERLKFKYMSFYDDPQSLSSFCFECRLKNITPDIEEYIKSLYSVSPEDIRFISSSVKEQIIYSLS